MNELVTYRQPFPRSVRACAAILAFCALCAVAVFASASTARANAGNPDSSTARWAYVSGNSGPVNVTVTGTWDWGTVSQPGGGPGSQSCDQGAPPPSPGSAPGATAAAAPSQTDVNGHYAFGIAVDWGDASTPNTLTGHTVSGQPVTLKVGNTMDYLNPNYCAGTTASNPYPSGTFSASHQYPSLAAFLADTNNGQVCVNAYDVHQDTASEEDPATNGDNTLANNQYDLSVDCSSASQIATPAATSSMTPPSTPKPALTSLSIVKTERNHATGGGFTAGPITVEVGDRVDYQIVVHNNGSDTLTVHLVDPGCQIRSGATLDLSGITLAAGASDTYHCSHLIDASDRPVYKNTATANGVSSSATAVPATSSVSANIPTVLAAHHVVTHKVKPVTHKAKPAPKVVAPATFTG